MPFEPHNPGVFEGDAAVEVLDPNGVLPASIINAVDAFTVRISLTFRGTNAAWNLNNAGFEWLVRAFVDNIGPPWNQEVQLGADTIVNWVPFVTNPGPPPTYTYTINVNVPANTLQQGIYKLGAVIVARPVGGGALQPVYGFAEGGTFMVKQ